MGWEPKPGGSLLSEAPTPTPLPEPSLASALAHGFAHEVKNPLAAVLSNLDFLLQATRDAVAPIDPAHTREALLESLAAAEQIRRIIDVMSALAAGQSTRATPVRLCDGVWSAARRLRESTAAAGHTLKLDLDPAHWVLAGEGEVDQITTNLCANAHEAMRDAQLSGEIWVRTHIGAPGFVDIIVEDTGPGFAPEMVDRATLPFQTSRSGRGGTGLGLTIVRAIVESRAGTLAISRRVERGARVTVRLPAARPER